MSDSPRLPSSASLLPPLAAWPVFAAALCALMPAGNATPELEEFALDAAMPPEPAREFRAAWITTVHNLDWPSREGLPASKQQEELRTILDLCRDLRLNTVVLQVRSECDAFYRSSLEPFAPWLTGTMGEDPGYDPLQFAIEEAQTRGLELHAWFNPFRVINSPHGLQSASHVSRTHPGEMRRYGSKVWLEPTRPFARDRALQVIQEVVRNYEIDGVHLDDYFYPYPVKKKNGQWLPFPDGESWEHYQASGGSLEMGDWRRQAVNSLVEELYRSVKQARPHCKVGLSPFGIWRPGYPEQVKTSLDSYHGIFADTRLWWQQGWMDYCAPQLYWKLKDRQYGFGGLYHWWAEENLAHRHLWPGIASHRVRSLEEPLRRAAESVAQIEAIRQDHPAFSDPGHIHFSIRSLLRNQDKLSDVLKTNTYRDPALVPSLDWLGRPSLPRVRVQWAASGGPGGKLSWSPLPSDESVRWWLLQSYREGAWTTHPLKAAGTRDFEFQQPVEKVSIRAVARSGHLGPATTIRPVRLTGEPPSGSRVSQLGKEDDVPDGFRSG